MSQNSDNTRNFKKQYWNYFLSLQDDFLDTERFVAIEEDNFDTFSLEYNRLYQAICSEIDVLAKYLCYLLGDLKANNFPQYCHTITSYCGLFTNEEIYIKHFITMNPWKDWTSYTRKESKNPEWWTLYNKVKHNRQSICTDSKSRWHNKPYYKSATLQNILLSLSALYILEFYCLLIICKKDCNSTDNASNSIYNSMLPLFSSKLFRLKSWDECHKAFIGEFIDKNLIEKKMIEHHIKIEEV